MQPQDTHTAIADTLISWNDGAAKQALVEFISKVTEKGNPDFVLPWERIAVFDNDGTLWVEQPVPVQAFFALDRLRALAPQHPEWLAIEPFASALKGDLNSALAGGEAAIVELVMATHAGMTTEEFEQIAAEWIATARHPGTGRLYTELVYQPMLELLTCLRANGFTVWIASAGGIEFMRPWTERVYGIPRENVIGSSIKTKYELRDGRPVLVRLPELNFIGDKAGKPVGIQQHIGRRPIAAFGNSDGDFEMLDWVTSGAGARFGLLIHHDDAAREFAYDRAAVAGKFDRGLDEAPGRGWTLVSMKRDWKRVFAFEHD
jgi:phosphoserine phosphatase